MKEQVKAACTGMSPVNMVFSFKVHKFLLPTKILFPISGSQSHREAEACRRK